MTATINDLADRLGYIRVDENWGSARRPGDLRVPADCQAPARSPGARGAAGAVLPGSLLVSERIQAGLRRLNEEFIREWRPYSEGSLLIVARAPAKTDDDAWWLVDLTARKAVTGSGNCDEDPGWAVTAPAATWEQVIRDGINLGTAFRRHGMRYRDKGDGGPGSAAAENRVAMMSDLLGITTWKPGRGGAPGMGGASGADGAPGMGGAPAARSAPVPRSASGPRSAPGSGGEPGAGSAPGGGAPAGALRAKGERADQSVVAGTPHGPPDTRRQPLSRKADLDAALWSASPGRVPEVVVRIGAGPAGRPVRSATPPGEARPPGPVATPAGMARPAGLAMPAPGLPRLPDPGGYDSGPALPPQQGPVAGKPRPMSGRERMRMVRARQARRRWRIRVAAVGVAVLTAAVIVGITVRHGPAATTKSGWGYAGPYAPVTLNADNSVTMAQPGITKPVLDVYEDFQCSVCRAFENASGAVIQQLADQGKLKVVYHPFTIFTGQPQQANSIRAWAAAKCAPANLWARYHNALYASQPAQTTVGGFPVSLLVRLGRDVGITGPGFAQCVRSQRYAVQNPPVSDQIINGGVNGMPTVKLDGRVLSANQTSSGLRRQILSAL